MLMTRLPSRSTQVDAAIDLGTANTTVMDRSGAVLFEEPSLCCFDGESRHAKVLAVGTSAHRYAGRVTGSMHLARPLRNGVLNDLHATTELLRAATRAIRVGWPRRAPRTMIGIPADATQAERRALSTAALDAGLAEPILVSEPTLATIGLGFDIEEARGRMVIDCGAGVTEVAVLSLGGICATSSVRGGGDEFDDLIAQFLQLQHRFRVGQSTAEKLKLDFSQALADDDEHRILEVKGLHLPTGSPTTVSLPATDLMPAWDHYSDRIVTAVLETFGATSPELAQDVLEDGIWITGGAAPTGPLARKIERATGTRVNLAELPRGSVARGLARCCGLH